MDKTYKVIFRDGSSQIVSGNLVFINSGTTAVQRVTNAVYVNVDEAILVVEQTKTSDTNCSNE